MRRPLEPQPIPADRIVGRVFASWEGRLYRCLHHDGRRGYWMQRLDAPPALPAAEAANWGRYVGIHVFGWTWHPAPDQPAQELAA